MLLQTLLSSFGLALFLLDPLLPILEIIFDVGYLFVESASKQLVSELPERQYEGGNKEGFSFGLHYWHAQVGEEVRHLEALGSLFVVLAGELRVDQLDPLQADFTWLGCRVQVRRVHQETEELQEALRVFVCTSG